MYYVWELRLIIRKVVAGVVKVAIVVVASTAVAVVETVVVAIVLATSAEEAVYNLYLHKVAQSSVNMS